MKANVSPGRTIYINGKKYSSGDDVTSLGADIVQSLLPTGAVFAEQEKMIDEEVKAKRDKRVFKDE